MKKVLFIIGGVVVAAGLVTAVVLFMHSGDDKGSKKGTTSSTSTTTTGSGSYKVVAACQAFTLADAKAVLGSGAAAGSGNGLSDSASGDVAVSTCSYSGAPGLTAQDTRTITLLSRSAKSAAGAASNKSVFGKDKPVGKQDVSGVGDAAFWDSTLSQLDVLKGNNWYIIGNMSGTHADSGSYDVSKAVYDRIKGRL